ncbi:TRAP transporter large permease [Marinobacter zhejiangensis]|uniref:TRAP transporter, DctM subunit n=1 Tax=Marinobacter zhejiangensis TaxID=488535 RepID=A0A1I4T526_9GAMM|nr:TRAP transporter large permease subunit [Marinobacter zhejiangensis]SFM71727.1 TRAP transporter, DctM subunit [Marinobacter zhejiangensis]
MEQSQALFAEPLERQQRFGLDKGFTILTRLSLVFLIVLASLTCADVIARTVFSYSFAGTYELSELLISVVVAGLIASSFFESHNIKIELFSRFRPLGSSLNRLFEQLLSLCALGVISWSFMTKAMTAYEYGETTSVLGLQTYPVWGMAGAASIVLALIVVAAMARAVWEHLRGIPREKILAPLLMVGAVVSAGAVYVTQAGDSQTSAMFLVVGGFLSAYALILIQVPVGISLLAVGALAIGSYLGVSQALAITGNVVVGTATSLDLIAIPLFLLMGNFATASDMSGQIYRAASSVLGSRKGGLAIASIVGCGGFGAICGSSIATTATFGKVAFSEMVKRRYSTAVAAGTIAAGGTLGALIPPSVVLIIYSIIAEVSIQESFQAALIPGLLALVLYCIAIMITIRLKPELAPEVQTFDRKTAVEDLVKAWRPVVLFGLVVGGLYGGVFTTQEAGSVGAVLALLFFVFSKGFSAEAFWESLQDTARNSAAIYVIYIGASVFATLMSFAGAADLILDYVNPQETPHVFILVALVVIYLAIGTVFDTVAAVLVTAPVVLPLIVGMGYDLVWWGVVTLSLVEIGMITPPLGINVFVMKSVVGDRVQMKDIFRGVTPFLVADALRIVLLVSFPAIALWLPSVI